MRWRVAALIALSGTVAIPAVSDALQPVASTSIRVSVKPRDGSARTHFAVSFRASVSTGPSFHNTYRITASGPARGACQSNAAVTAAAPKVGRTVHAVLAPSGLAHWCDGAYAGKVWDVMTVVCPVGKACPAFEPLPQLVGRFTFHVTRG